VKLKVSHTRWTFGKQLFTMEPIKISFMSVPGVHTEVNFGSNI